MPMRRPGASDMPFDPGADCADLNAGNEAEGRACFSHVFAAEPLAVRDALRRAVARFARQLSEEDAGTLELVLAEALNNIAEHAYAGCAPGPVTLTLRRCGNALDGVIEDEGRALPGGSLPAGRMQPVADRPADLAEGGWGWALIRALAQDIRYRRDAGGNRLTFRILLGAG